MEPSRKPRQRVGAGRYKQSASVIPVVNYTSTGAPMYPALSVDHYSRENDPEVGLHAAPSQFQDLDAIAGTCYPHEQRQSFGDGYGPLSLPRYEKEKFPELDFPEFSFVYDPDALPPPSIVSSLSSTTSRRSSSRSTLSSISTALPPQSQTHPECLSGPPTWSRGPSPLRNISSTFPSPTEASQGSTLRAYESFREPSPTATAIDIPSQILRPHVCLWGTNGPCESGGFATKEELNWHVKAEHLLVCPVLGCTEGSFANRELIEVHVKWAHKCGNDGDDSEHVRRSSNLLASTMDRSPSSSRSQPTETPANRQNQQNDMRLKMDMTIATSKKKCREQLRSVAEKKSKRNAGKPRSCFNKQRAVH